MPVVVLILVFYSFLFSVRPYILTDAFSFAEHPFSSQQEVCSEAEATDLTECCELISDRLMALEDELQTAIQNRDQSLAHILSIHSEYTQIVFCVFFICVGLFVGRTYFPQSLSTLKRKHPNLQ